MTEVKGNHSSFILDVETALITPFENIIVFERWTFNLNFTSTTWKTLPVLFPFLTICAVLPEMTLYIWRLVPPAAGCNSKLYGCVYWNIYHLSLQYFSGCPDFLKITAACPGHDTSALSCGNIPRCTSQAYALKHIYWTHPQTHIEVTHARAHTHTRWVVRAGCKIRGAVNGGGQLGCCFIKVQRKCRSVSCRKQGIGSASFCLLNLKHRAAGIRQPLPLNSDFLMAVHGKYLLTVVHVLIRPSGAQTCPLDWWLYFAASYVATWRIYFFLWQQKSRAAQNSAFGSELRYQRQITNTSPSLEIW